MIGNRTALGTVPMLERDGCISALETVFAKVRVTGGQAVLIRGEAGIGKSTVIESFIASLPDETRTALALCDPLQTPRPLGAVRDLDTALSHRSRPLLDDAELFEGFLHRLQQRDHPIVLVIEDLHWVDQRSLDWIQYIARRLSQLQVLLIGSYRDDEARPDHPLRSALGAIPASRKTQITLAPLSLDAVRRLGTHNRLSAEALRDITGGNPFYLTEVLNHPADDRIVPASVADAVNARLNALPAPLCRFLETVSCCPGTIPFDQLRKMEDGPQHCDSAVARKLLVPVGSNVKFRHELARLAVYDRMQPAARRDAHAFFLDNLTAQSPEDASIDRIIHHALGAHRTDLLLSYAPRAATEAANLGAHREAAEYLALVLPNLDGQPKAFAAEMYETWAYEAGLALSINDEVIAARSQAVALWREVGDAERVGENLRWLSRLHWYRGEAETATRYIHEAIAVLDNQDASPAKAKAFALRAQFHMLQDQMAEAIEWGEKALALAAEVGEREITAHALNTIGSARMFRGDAMGEAQLRESLDISRAHGFHEQAARVYTNLSECLVEARALEAASELLEEGIAFDTAHDLDSWTYYLIGRKAHLLFEMDRYSEAITVAEDVLGRDNQTLLMRMPAIIIRARAHLRTGHPDAVQHLQDALADARKINEPQYLTTVNVALIEVAVLHLDPTVARDALDWLRKLDPDQISPRKRGEALFWSRLAGEDIAGLDCDILPAGFRLMAKGDFGNAQSAFDAEQSRYLALWSRAFTGSRKAIADADAAFRDMGVRAARAALRRHFDGVLGPLRQTVKRDSKPHPYGLTRAELKVLRHVVDGKSNSAIAGDLGRSRRTVENHVASILSKLRCRNRVDVVLRCQSEPWILPT
ncbi:LuxR family transcriptional regulator [uncultured Marivita sp.]|uniref:helix-turn-helix transcriptional regulator n=1 Tax=uncultured Marivita sp. TaxID=888080 RepID=UPI002627ABF6|nr:LuxR family transcriptional regulator [uncultured Marivita sp.]